MLTKLKSQYVAYIYLSLLKGPLSLFNLTHSYADTDSLLSLLREFVSCKSKSIFVVSGLTYNMLMVVYLQVKALVYSLNSEIFIMKANFL